MHLTNYAIQKNSDDFVRDEESGSKRLVLLYKISHAYGYLNLMFLKFREVQVNGIRRSLFFDKLTIFYRCFLVFLNSFQTAIIKNGFNWLFSVIVWHCCFKTLDPEILPESICSTVYTQLELPFISFKDISELFSVVLIYISMCVSFYQYLCVLCIYVCMCV